MTTKVYITPAEQGTVSLFMKSLRIPGEGERRPRPLMERILLRSTRCLYCGGYCAHPIH